MTLDGIVEWATELVEALGPLGVGLLVVLENLFPPIPSEVVLPLAGFVSATGGADLTVMIGAATIGSLVGSYLLYGIAASIGPVRLRLFVVEHGRWLGLTEDDLDRAEAWFDGRANRAVLVCRCVPLMRSLISIPAGLRRMPLLAFTGYTLVGSLVWNTALVVAGYLLGDRWEVAGEPIELLQQAVLIVIGVTLLWFIWRRVIQPRWQRRTTPN
ncbi:MAG TPA: DedA family protein [Acidimicrobiia bacterium]|nr:DedA family protein [Acidimicrobiia bacterium]